MGAAERDARKLRDAVEPPAARVQIVPLAILQGITGVGLIITGNIDVLKLPWLMIAIVLYLIAIGFAIFVQTPTGEADHRDDRRRPPDAGGPPPGPGPAAAGGPPPELMRPRSRTIQRGGMLLDRRSSSAIVFLMVVKPAF